MSNGVRSTARPKNPPVNKYLLYAFGSGTPVRGNASRFVRPLFFQAGPNTRTVRGSTVHGAEVQIVIPEGGCTRGDFIKLLEEATGERNVGWKALH